MPPLEVQREIARILDAYAEVEEELKEELEEELEARRTQYTHYRDALIMRSGAPTVPLGELGTLTRGRRFTKADYVTAGIPSIHYGEIYTEYGVATTEARSRVREDLRTTLRYAAPGDLVIAGTGENVAEVAKAVAWLGAGEVAIHDDCFAYRHTLEPRYASYAFQTRDFQEQKAQSISESKVVRISSANLAKIEIPVPPLDDQRRIADILDSFDALVNDLSSRLPAEIAARRQQYEHYCDRLLTFKELGS
jgi:type I restriction enzyme S subunit